jgi:hypothetical protein
LECLSFAAETSSPSTAPAGSALHSPDEVSASSVTYPDRHALLIGIQDYSASTLRSLQGPHNDIALVRHLLESRFGVPKDNIVVLSDAQATHTRIKQAFAQLVERIKPGDFVYIHYSGHGSEADDRSDPSGKDQTWVSYGARSGRSKDIDDHDVLDKEINTWLIPLYEKTNRLVFVSDSCHSATVSRGELVGVRAVPQDPRPHPLAKERFKTAAASGVRIGAARDIENAVEMVKEHNTYGLFTWFWTAALDQAKPGETWDDVFKRAYTLVTTERGVFQYPQLEGHGGQAVFGGQFPAQSPRVAATRVDEGGRTVRVGVGSINGATAKSIYRLYQPGVSGESRAGPTLELTRVEAYFSEGTVREGDFKVGDLVVEAEHAYPFEPLKLTVEGDYANAQDSGLVTRIQGALKGLEGFTLVSDRSHADWIIRVLRPQRQESDSGHPAPPSTTLPPSSPDQAPEVWVISPQEELLHEKMRIALKDPDRGMQVLQDNLKKFARMQEIKRLASRGEPPAIAITVSQLRPLPDCERDCVLLPDEQGREISYRKTEDYPLDRLPKAALQQDDILTFTVKNEGKRDYYLYLLNLSRDGGIAAIFPNASENAESARLAAGESRNLSQETALLLNTPGEETIKVIASRQPIAVSLFEAQGYEDFRGQRENLNPLERLLAEAMFTRGKPIDVRESEWGTWQVVFPVVKP